jgi:hypothetical protein
MLLDWQVDAAPRQERTFHLAAGGGPSATAARTVQLTDKGDRIEVDTGPLQFSIARTRLAPLDNVRLHGVAMTRGPLAAFFTAGGQRIEPQPPSTVTVTEQGPLRTRIEMRGRYAASFDYVVRLDAFADQSFVRVLHTFEQRSAEPYTLVGQIGLDLPMTFKDPVSYAVGMDQAPPLTGTLPAKGLTIYQEDADAVYVAGARRAGRAAGWVDLHDATHGVAVAARFFWQEYPQSFELRGGGLTYNLWAPEAPPASVGMGAAKTHELMLYFHGKDAPAPAQLAALASPLLARIDPAWTAASGALRNAVAPSAAVTPFLQQVQAAYDRVRATADADRWDDSGRVRCPAPSPAPAGPTPIAPAPSERPRRGYFGMFNWGDWNFPGYHDTTKGCDAWGNLEYDLPQVLALAYAATGHPAYAEGLVASARHFMDVDRIYFQPGRPTWIGMNHPKNPLHFSFALGGVDLGHTWTEGLLSYYYLTGDERGLAAARGIADYLVRRQATVLRGNPRQWGWPQIALVAAYEATGDASYRSAALAYARGGMAAHPAERVNDWKAGILAEGLSYTHAVTRDGAIRDWLSPHAAAVAAQAPDVDARFLPALAYAGVLEANERYLQLAAAGVERLKLGSWGKPFTIAGRVGFRVLALTQQAHASARAK